MSLYKRIAKAIVNPFLVVFKLMAIFKENIERLLMVLMHPLGWLAVALMLGGYLLVKLVLPFSRSALDRWVRRLLALSSLISFLLGLFIFVIA